jgi:hypothetical protein
VPSRNLIQTIAAIVAAVYLISFAAQGAPVSDTWLAPFGSAVSAATLLLLAFDLWLWRLPLVCRLVKRPLVHGTWRGTLSSYYINPETNQRVAPAPDVYFVIKQRFWSITMRLLTKESKPTSIVGVIDNQGDGSYAIISVYRNTPKLRVRDRSPIHHGAVMLDVSGKPATRLEGFYWTDRKTMGELDLTQRFGRLISDHSEGIDLR